MLSEAGSMRTNSSFESSLLNINHTSSHGKIALADRYLCINVGQAVSTELVKKPPVFEMLHDHCDKLWVSRRKVGLANVHVTATLRHAKSK